MVSAAEKPQDLLRAAKTEGASQRNRKAGVKRQSAVLPPLALDRLKVFGLLRNKEAACRNIVEPREGGLLLWSERGTRTPQHLDLLCVGEDVAPKAARVPAR